MRQMFHYKDGTLLQGRMYPDHAKENPAYGTLRALVQAIIAECEDVPNLWHTTHDNETIRDNTVTDGAALHYPDYEKETDDCCLSRFQERSYSTVIIGSKAYDVETGKVLNNSRTNRCIDSPVRTCHYCDTEGREADGVWIDHNWYCDNCWSVCDECHTYFVSELGRMVSGQLICAECADLIENRTSPITADDLSISIV